MLLRGSYHVKRNSVRQAGAAGAPAWTAYALASRCAVPMRRSAPWALTPGRRVAWPAGSGLRPDDRVRREHRRRLARHHCFGLGRAYPRGRGGGGRPRRGGENSRRSGPAGIVGVTGIFYLLVVCAKAFAFGPRGVADFTRPSRRPPPWRSCSLWGILFPGAYTLVNLLSFIAFGWLLIGAVAAGLLPVRRPAVFQALGRRAAPDE